MERRLPDAALDRPLTGAPSAPVFRLWRRTARSKCSSRTGVSSTPVIRSARSGSAPTGCSTCREATARASRSRTTARTESPVNPCGDPIWERPSPTTAEGGALREPGRPNGRRPAGLNGAVLRARSDHRRCGGPGNPGLREQRRKRAPHRRARPPEPLPLHDPAGDERGLAGRCRLERLGGDQPGRRRRPASSTSAGRATGANTSGVSLRQGGYDNANLNICENLYNAGTGAVVATVLHRPPRRPEVVAADGCRTDVGSSIAGLAFYPSSGGSYPSEYATPSSSPTTAGSASG